VSCGAFSLSPLPFDFEPPKKVVRPSFLPTEPPVTSSGIVRATTAITKATAAVPKTAP
jgi:hypothetical protein